MDSLSERKRHHVFHTCTDDVHKILDFCYIKMAHEKIAANEHVSSEALAF